MQPARIGKPTGEKFLKGNGKGISATDTSEEDNGVTVTSSDLSSDTRLIIVAGDISTKNINSLEEKVAEALGLSEIKRKDDSTNTNSYTNEFAGYTRFVINFSGVTSVSSRTVGTLNRLFYYKFEGDETIAGKNIKFVQSTQTDAAKSIRLMGLYDLFETYQKESTARLAFDLDMIINRREMLIGDIRKKPRRTGALDRRIEVQEVGVQKRTGLPTRRSGLDRREIEYRGRYSNVDSSIQIINETNDPIINLDDKMFLYLRPGKIPDAKRLYLGITHSNPTTRALTLIELAKTYMVGDPTQDRLYRKARILIEWKTHDPETKVQNYAKLLLALSYIKSNKDEDDTKAIQRRIDGINALMKSQLVSKQPDLVRKLLTWKAQTDCYEKVKLYAAQQLDKLAAK